MLYWDNGKEHGNYLYYNKVIWGSKDEVHLKQPYIFDACVQDKSCGGEGFQLVTFSRNCPTIPVYRRGFLYSGIAA